jgi:alkylation response protein AidB-like acyl-CoA dehydrogenase
MRLSLTDNESALRDEVRAYLAEHAPDPETIPRDLDGHVAFMRCWQRQAQQARLVGVSWPREYGGRGAGLGEQIIVNREMARAGVPQLPGYVGIDVVGPTIVAHGTEAQKQALLERILSGEEIWCQGFSEPGAGSDLAALKTRAVDEGDHFRLSGQKVWTSYAQYARWCAVLARTDPDAPAHKGITYLLVDMRSSGIQVSPLVMSSGEAEFGEVFFDDVIVPHENVLGERDAGWKLAMHTLAHERGPYAMTRQVTLSVMLDRLIHAARQLPREGRPAIESPEIESALTRARVSIEVLGHQTHRTVGHMIATGQAGFESSIDKLMLAQAEHQLAAAAMDVLGAYAAAPHHPAHGDLDPWHQLYLYGRAASVYGGSAEIQRNIIAQRILNLPREH